MILPIYTYGQPVLREPTKPIDKDYPDLKKLIADMFETMYHADGVGLAAPQIGRSICLVVIDGTPVANDRIECKDFKRVLINPEIIEESHETVTFEEGCLSFPGVHEKVTRPEKIKVRYMNEHFEPQEESLEGFAARIVLHEYEHLQGHVFIDNISAIRRQLNKGKLNNIIKGTTSCSYRIKPLKK
ncbi:MAG: peptide deformylase [Tannerella sp.]|uniref:peptide deformylase n=1 Tax=Tannerella sp. TaxID=2382127 RepID=UPI003FA2229D